MTIEIKLEELVPAWEDYPKKTTVIAKMQKLKIQFLYDFANCDKCNSIPMPLGRYALMENYGNLKKLYKVIQNEILWNGKSKKIICRDHLNSKEVDLDGADIVLSSEDYLMAVSTAGNQLQIDFSET